MTTQHILFIIFGAVTLGAALMVVTRRNVYQAALFLTLSLFGVAGLYVLLEAPLLAAVQLLTYVGGIAPLIILAVVFTQGRKHPADSPDNHAGYNHQWWIAALAAIALCSVLVWVTLSYDWGTAPGPVSEHSIAILLSTLIAPEGFALSFAVTVVLLLVSLTGAVTITGKQ